MAGNYNSWEVDSHFFSLWTQILSFQIFYFLNIENASLPRFFHLASQHGSQQFLPVSVSHLLPLSCPLADFLDLETKWERTEDVVGRMFL